MWNRHYKPPTYFHFIQCIICCFIMLQLTALSTVCYEIFRPGKRAWHPTLINWEIIPKMCQQVHFFHTNMHFPCRRCEAATKSDWLKFGLTLNAAWFKKLHICLATKVINDKTHKCERRNILYGDTRMCWRILVKYRNDSTMMMSNSSD